MLQSSITAWLKKPASVTTKTVDVSVDTPSALVEHLPVPKEQPVKVSDAVSSNPSKSKNQNTTAEQAPISNGNTTEQTPKPQENTTHSQPPITNPFSLKPLPPNVELVPLTEDLMPSFKRLNSVLLPIPYPPAFYTETMTEPHHSVTLVALWHSAPVDPSPSNTSPNSPSTPSAASPPRLIGAIRCRILPNSTLYISTIGLLSPYRHYGIATHLLHQIIVKSQKLHGIRCVTAHVWEANEDGLEWYGKRGFEVLAKEDGYYRKLRPTGAWLVRKWIGVGDLLAGGGGGGGER